MKSTSLIFQEPWGGFGDLWAMISESIFQKSCYYSLQNIHPQSQKKIFEIFNVLKTPQIPIFTKSAPNVRRIRVEDVNHLYIPTSVIWKIKQVKPIITYQIFSPHWKCLPKKILPAYDCVKFELLKKKYQKKITFIELGKNYSLSEVVRLMSISICFFGICSGMSHIAHSVQVPTLIWNWEDLKKYHPKKEYIPVNNMEYLEKYIREKI